MASSPGKDQIQKLRQGGFPEEDIARYQQETSQKLNDGGFAPSDVDKYFGKIEPDMSTERSMVQAGFANLPPQTQADGILDSFAAGWQISGVGLTMRQQMPDTIIPEDAGIFERMANMAGTFAGDSPLVVAGFIGGATAGAPAGPVGSFTLGGAGSAALPEAYRQVLMDHFEATANGEGSIFTSEDWLTRVGSIMYETGKQAVAGAVGGAAGQKAVQLVTKVAIPVGGQVVSRAMGEITGYTAGMSAMTGELPDLQDFLAGGVFAVGMAGGTHVGAKYGPATVKLTTKASMDIYNRTGITPEGQKVAASKLRVVQQEMTAMDPNGKARPTVYYSLKKPDPTPMKVKDADGKLVDAPPKRDWHKEASDIDRAEAVGDIDFRVANRRKIKLAEQKADAQLSEEAVPADRSQLSEGELAIANLVAEGPKKGTLRNMINEFDFDKAYTKIAREYHPLDLLAKELEAEGVTFDPDVGTPGQLFAQTYSSSIRAGYMIKNGPIEFGTNKALDGPSYLGAMDQVKADGGTAEGLTYYRLAKYTLERSERGIDTGIPLDTANNVVKEGNAKYAKAESMVQEVKNGVLDYFLASELPTEKTINTIKALNKHHIPTKRLLSELGPDGSGKARGRGLRVRIPFKKATGSKERIVDPVLTEVENMHLLVALADRQKVAKVTIEAIEKLALKDVDAAASIATKSKKMTERVRVDENAVTKILEEYGVDASEAKVHAKAMEPMIMYRKVQASLGPDDILFFRKGKPEVWTFTDPEVAKVFKGADPLETGLLIGIATKIANMKRAGLTGAPDFALRNVVFRDNLIKAITQEGYNPLTAPVKGFWEVVGGGESHQQYLREGGGGTSIVSMDINRVKIDIQKLYQDTGVTGKVLNEIRHPIELSRKVTELLDASIREGGFKADIEAGRPVPEAIQRAREGSLDLMQRGSSQIVNIMAKTIPFFRPSLLGIEQLGRAMKKNPKSFALKSAMYVTLPEVMLYFLNDAVDAMLKDDPDRISYADQPRWLKDLYWHIPVPIGGTGGFIRYPKPIMVGQVFGSGVARFLDWSLKNDPRAFKDMGKSVLGSFVPTFIPAIIDPIASIAFDTNLFTMRPLTPSSLEKNSAHMQYTEYTSETGKALSQMLYQGGIADLSPIQIEALVRGYTGTVGIAIMKELDAAFPSAPVRPDRFFFELPFIKSFFSRQPGSSAKPVTDFYDKVDAFNTRAADFKLAIKRGDMVETMEAAAFDGAFIKITNITKANSVIIETIKRIHRNKDMKAVEKRQLIDSQYMFLRNSSKLGVSIMDALVPVGEE